MSEYKRMVSYFYRYEKEEKKYNAGFAKLECMKDTMRLSIQIQDKNNIVGGAYDIYLYRDRGQIVEKRKLGRTIFANQNMTFRCTADAKNVMETGTSIEDYDGMILCFNGQLYYATQWSEKSFDGKKIMESGTCKQDQKVIHKSGEEMHNDVHTKENNVDKFTELCEKIGKISENYRKIQEMNKNLEENVDKDPGNEDNLVASELDSKKTETVWQAGTNASDSMHLPRNQHSALKEEGLKQREKNQNTGYEASLQDKEKEEWKPKEKEVFSNQDKKLTGIAYLLKHRSRLSDFSNHEVLQCVKIMPEDIGYMNRKNWEYGNNSFVMHGFYNYHYLLLGCMYFQDGKRQYVLGVPGVYSNKDKYLAEIFKFREFIPLRNGPHKTGEFGYWLARLSE